MIQVWLEPAEAEAPDGGLVAFTLITGPAGRIAEEWDPTIGVDDLVQRRLVQLDDLEPLAKKGLLSAVAERDGAVPHLLRRH